LKTYNIEILMFSFFQTNSTPIEENHLEIETLKGVINHLENEIKQLKQRIIHLEVNQEDDKKYPLLKSIFYNMTNKQLLTMVPKMDKAGKQTKKDLVNSLLTTLKRKIPSKDFMEIYQDKFHLPVKVIDLLTENQEEVLEEWNILMEDVKFL